VQNKNKPHVIVILAAAMAGAICDVKLCGRDGADPTTSPRFAARALTRRPPALPACRCAVLRCDDPGHREFEDHTQFVLKVSYGSMRSWEVYKRYSQFENMHWALREELSGSLIELPPLPPKKFCGSMDPAFLDEREEQLQDYLVQLLQLPGVMEVETFLNFVEDPNEESIDHDE